MSTVVGGVAALCSAYCDGRRIVQDLRRRRRDNPAPLPDAEDFHTEALASSLDKGKSVVKSQYDHCIFQIGSSFARGDEEACRQLREIGVSLQVHVIQPLKIAWHENTSLDLVSLQDASNEGQDRAVFCLLELHQRMLLAGPAVLPPRHSLSPHQSFSSGSSTALLDLGTQQDHWTAAKSKLDTNSYSTVVERSPSLTTAGTVSSHLTMSPPPLRALPTPPSTASDREGSITSENETKSSSKRSLFRRNKVAKQETRPPPPTTPLVRPSTSPNPGHPANVPNFSLFPVDLPRTGSNAGTLTPASSKDPLDNSQNGNNSHSGSNGTNKQTTAARPAGAPSTSTDNSKPSPTTMGSPPTGAPPMGAPPPLPKPPTSKPSTPIFRSPLQKSESFVVPGAHQREYLPSEKNNYQGLCKSAWRLQTGQQKKALKARSRLVTAAGHQTVGYWACTGCDFEGKLVKLGKEERFDATINAVSAQTSDGYNYTVRWRWGFLFRSHFPFKSPGGWDAYKMALQRANFGCVFCCALGLQMHPLSGVRALVEHLVAEHVGEGRWPKDEVLYRLNCLIGERAPEGAEWDLNMFVTAR